MRGHSKKNWVGVCSTLPKTLTLFMTKVCDFPYSIYDLTKKKLDPQFMTIATGTVEGLLLMVLSIEM